MAITWKWGGTSIAATRASGAVWTVEDWEFGPIVFRPRAQRMEMHGGEIETFDPLAEFSRDWRLVVKVDASGVTGSSPTDESRALDAWEEAASFFSPLAGRTALECTRPDADGASVVRYLYASCLEVPQFRTQMYDPQGLKASGAYTPTSTPYVIYVARGDTRFPYWIDTTLLSTDTSAAAAELAISLTPDTVTINNPFSHNVGVKLVVKTGSVSGSVDEVTVTNNTNSSQIVVSDDSGSMDQTEYVDWYATDPVAHTRSADWSLGAGCNLYLSPGNNTLESQITGVGAGTCTFQVYWPKLSYTI